MTEADDTPENDPAKLSPSRALAHALFAALVVAHVQPMFVTSAALIHSFAQDHVVALPLIAAEWIYDFVWLSVLGGIVAFGATRARAHPDTLRAWLLALLAGVLAGLGVAARLELGGLGSWAVFAAVASAVFAAVGLASRTSPLGFVLGVTFLALGCGYSNALAGDAGTIALNHLGALALTCAAVWSTRNLRAPMLLFSAIVVLALGAIAESNWLAGLSSASPAPAAATPAVQPEAPDEGSAPNLIVIVLDTFRADAFDPSPDGNTPNLAAFAAEARAARSARSTSSWTLPGHASLFTGNYPTTHGAHFLPRGTSPREAGTLDDAQTTLAELLSARGYATWGVVANHGYLHSDTNIDQGFDLWDDRYAAERSPMAALSALTPRLAGMSWLVDFARAIAQLGESERHYLSKTYRIGAEVSTSALALLDREHAGQPFFLFLNYMDAHAPYVPTRSTRAEVGAALNEAWLDLQDGLGGVDPAGPGGLEVMRGERDLLPEERGHLEAAYVGEVHDVDAALGELLSELRARDLYEDAWIVITGDHGEFLGEHRLLGHASELYEEALRVPLFVRSPGGTDRRPIPGQVQLVDILPSLAPHFGFSLAGGVDGLPFDEVGTRAAIAEHFEYPQFVDAFGARFAGDRRAWIDATTRLYTFTARPTEWEGDTSTEAKLDAVRALSTWLSEHAPAERSEAQPELSPEERRRLERLGYL